MTEHRNAAHYSPNVVQIELVQGCNRSCSFCGVAGLESRVHYATFDTVGRICELIEASEHDPRILLAGHGEPTLHPELLDMLKLIRKKLPNSWIQLMTNGQSIRKDIHNLGRMYLAGLDDVTIDEYSDSRFPEDEPFMEEIKALKERKDIKVNFVRMAKGIKLYEKKTLKSRRLLIVPPIDLDEITMSRTLINHCGAGTPPSNKFKHHRCAKVFRELTFRWDGNVAICCQDFRGQYPVASVHDADVNTFDDIWRHPRLEAARRVLYHDRRTFFPCNICTDPAMRPGLLPDRFGKETLEEPTPEDIELVNAPCIPLSEMRRRPWEKDEFITALHPKIRRKV